MARGSVYLVGAGPGDPDLLTVKAHRLIKNAELAVYDRLVSKEILSLLPKGAAKINVGKQPSNHPVPQEEINQILVRLALSGRTILRLKGGDPFLFGRGGEEATALRKAGIPFEVVPGITAAQGCSAGVTLPLTYRGIATSVRYLTGHCRSNGDLDFDWPGLADEKTTLVVYMGLANIEQIASQLMEHGRDPATPVLAVSRGTQRDQRQIYSVLNSISSDVKAVQLPSPVLFIVGDVINLGQPLGNSADAQHLHQAVAVP